MRFLLIAAAVLLSGLFASEAQAQYRYHPAPMYNWYWDGGGSTVEGDWLRGQAALWHGYGNYIHNQGQYELYHEQARRQYLENWRIYVETRQKLTEQYNARKAAEAAERRARNLQRSLENKNRTLSPKIGWNGKYYSSLEELRQDPACQQFLAQKRQNDEKTQGERFLHLILGNFGCKTKHGESLC